MSFAHRLHTPFDREANFGHVLSFLVEQRIHFFKNYSTTKDQVQLAQPHLQPEKPIKKTHLEKGEKNCYYVNHILCVIGLDFMLSRPHEG